jgi:C-terminal processing protease CtpA/Prc
MKQRTVGASCKATAQRLLAICAVIATTAVGLSACGGGGGGGGGGVLPPGNALPPSPTLAQQCAPTNLLAPAANRSGSLEQEKRWLRSYMDEAYLWFDEVPAVDPTLPLYSNVNDVRASLGAYFDDLLTPARTPSGKLKDEFSFTYPTADWIALSQAGAGAGYGIEWILGQSTPPRNLRIAYVDPGTPAAAAGLARGWRVLSINGVSIDDPTPAGAATINEGAFAPRAGTAYTFVFSDGAQATHTVTLTAGTVTRVPVQNASVFNVGGVRVGYLTFNDHITPAEGRLVAEFAEFARQGVTDLVLDLRYNGGGFLYIASQVSYMIAGGTRTSGKVFERLRFNSKRVADNSDPANMLPFFGLTSGRSNSGTSANQPLPQLNLSRVFILTSAGSCSASESIINGLRGIGVTVHLIGATTCGKPFGSVAKDNCGLSYFPIEFQGSNHLGFGDFADGFTPTCAVADDLTRQLGDPSEGMLAAALAHRATGACPSTDIARRQAAVEPGRLVRSPLRENKFR